MPNPERMFFIRLYTACFLVGGLLASWLAWGSDRVFADGFESPDRDYCDDPLIMPPGWLPTFISWPQAWARRDLVGGLPTYPNSPGIPVPMGSEKFGYRAIPFIPNPSQIVQMSWDKVQVGPGYRMPRPAEGMYFTISPCPGDFRSPEFGNDPFLEAGCRRGGSIGALTFHTLIGVPSDFRACQLIAGETYFMNVIAANPEDGLRIGEHSCEHVPNSAAGCDVNARHQAVQ